ncbi:putative mismatched base pair and cruciform DNA recognition protein [Aspergillus floccosus]
MSDTSNSNSNTSNSTIKSYVDQATGMAQRAMGSLTGDSSKMATGETTQSKAEAEHEASHTTAKLGPITADPHTGATATDNSQRTTGTWDQTVGSAKESLGNLVGNEGLRRAGEEQNARGKGAEAEGQLRDFGEGVRDRMQGGVGKVVAAAAGDRAEEEKWTKVHDEGKVRERGAEADMQKKA